MTLRLFLLTLLLCASGAETAWAWTVLGSDVATECVANFPAPPPVEDLGGEESEAMLAHSSAWYPITDDAGASTLESYRALARVPPGIPPER